MIENYGTYYTSYMEDGTAVVWCPKWCGKESKHANVLKQLIKGILEEAPLRERKEVGANILEWCRYMRAATDDHDLQAATFNVNSEYISSGHKKICGEKDGVKHAIELTISELGKFVTMTSGGANE
jgi:glycyl-tRNA synthetase beta subunit